MNDELPEVQSKGKGKDVEIPIQGVQVLPIQNKNSSNVVIGGATTKIKFDAPPKPP